MRADGASIDTDDDDDVDLEQHPRARAPRPRPRLPLSWGGARAHARGPPVRPRDKHAPRGFTVHPVALCSTLVGCLDATAYLLRARAGRLPPRGRAHRRRRHRRRPHPRAPPRGRARQLLHHLSSMVRERLGRRTLVSPVRPRRASSPPAALLLLWRAQMLTGTLPVPVSSQLRRRYLRRGFEAAGETAPLVWAGTSLSPPVLSPALRTCVVPRAARVCLSPRYARARGIVRATRENPLSPIPGVTLQDPILRAPGHCGALPFHRPDTATLFLVSH